MRYAPILIALAAAATARADGDRTLHLAVHGSVDSAALGESISKELGVEVAVIDGTCDVPCLDVTVDGKRAATVVYAPRAGSSRARTIKLGSNTSQWTVVLTLLAGNIVRDEARDVLATLPARDVPRGHTPAPDVPVPPEPAEDAPAPTPTPTATPVCPVPIAAPKLAGPPAPPPVAGPPLPPGVPLLFDDDAPDEAPLPPCGPAPIGPPELTCTIVPPTVAPTAPACAPSAPSDEPEPQPEASPPPGAAPEPEPEPEHAFLGLGLVPGLSTDLTHVGRVRHFLSFNALVGVSAGSSGLAVSGIADIERGLVAGFQVAGIVAHARQVAGTQIAGIAAVSGDVDGVQIAGTAAVANRLDGVQVGGIAAVARARAGTQAGGIVAFAGGDATAQAGGIASVARGTAGLQLGGIAAVAGHDANVQASGIASVARGTANIQLAGLVNYAHRLRGMQIAPINVAREVDGVQVGVINVGGSADGFSFGLINIVPGGRYDLEAAVDSDSVGTVLFRHGGRRWHNVYGVGGHRVDRSGPNDDVWMYGLGFGPSLPFGDTVIDLEAIAWEVNHGPRHEGDLSLLGQLRLSIAHHWGPFALVAGGIFNTYITNDPQSPFVIERRTSGAPMSTGVTVTTWPSAFIGVRI